MIDLTSTLLPKLAANRLPGLDFVPDIFYPSYANGSIASLPASVISWLGAEALPSAAPPLADIILAHWGQKFRRVIVLVVDGYGLDMLQQALVDAQSDAYLRVWADLPADTLLAPMTSVVPSTTAAALTTLWTGAYPAEHGVIGYTEFLKEYGLIANMILHSPASFAGEAGSLRLAGFKPETFLPVPMLGPHLTAQGIRVRAYQHRAIVRSGLSTMLLPGVELTPIHTLGDMFVSLSAGLESDGGGRSYSYAYWSELDDLCHRYGPGDVRFKRELADFSLQFGMFLRERLEQRSGDTLLVLTADHGHIHTPKDPALELRHHPELVECMAMLPSGESRLPYVFLRPGREERFRALVDAAWPGRFQVLPSADFIRAGMFGPRSAREHPHLADRAGDVVLIPREGDYLWFDPGHDNPLLGRHGGLSRTEMLVPLLAIPL